MLIQMIARPGRLSWRLIFDKMADKLKQTFPENNFVVVYPYCHSDEDYQADRIFSEELFLLKSIPGTNFSLNTQSNKLESVFREIIDKNDLDNKNHIYKELVSVLNDYPIELSPDIVLIHIHTTAVTDFQIYLSVNKTGFKIEKINSTPKLAITLLSPEGQQVQKHLNMLTEISKMVMVKGFIQNILNADNYNHFIKLITNSQE
jgi:mannitol/fructose-specific phosphotransferase system IIA component (Ntr-type)